MNYIREYWDKIQSGEITVCKKVKYQMSMLIDLLDNEPEPWVFDEELANLGIEFIEDHCRQFEGKWAGQRIDLMLWQKAIHQAVFGFVNRHTGFRKYKEVLVIEGRKNGKTTWVAGEAGFMLIADGEGGPQIRNLATKLDQAKILFNAFDKMRQQSPDLRQVISKKNNCIECSMNFGTFTPLASDSGSLDGLNVHMGIVDELHALKDRNLYDVVKQSMPARDQPLMFSISTAGFVRENIYDDLYNYAEDVLSGNIEDPEFLAFIYELDDRAEWLDESCWIKANPSLGYTKSTDFLRKQVKRAMTEPNYKNTVLTKDFNIRENSAASWLSVEDVINKETYDLKQFAGHYGIGGVDLSTRSDLSCAKILIQTKDDEKTYEIAMYFLPRENLEKKIKEDKIPYDVWADQGWLTLCDGDQVKYEDITKWFLKMQTEHKIYTIWYGYDRALTDYWQTDMEIHGFTGGEAVAQGAYTLSTPMKDIGADIKAGRYVYNNNPITRWCFCNTALVRDANDNWRPDKKNSRQRIDGTLATLNAKTIMLKKWEDYRGILKAKRV
jgi:phage terminase large subunit-like protein